MCGAMSAERRVKLLCRIAASVDHRIPNDDEMLDRSEIDYLLLICSKEILAKVLPQDLACATQILQWKPV